MPKSISHFIRSKDIYGHDFSIKFDKQIGIYQTRPGGLLSILSFILVFWLTIYNLYIMLTYGNDNIFENTIGTNFDELGLVDANRLNNSLPFYNFKSQDGMIKRKDDKVCGATGGDCFKFLLQYLDFIFL